MICKLPCGWLRCCVLILLQKFLQFQYNIFLCRILSRGCVQAARDGLNGLITTSSPQFSNNWQIYICLFGGASLKAVIKMSKINTEEDSQQENGDLSSKDSDRQFRLRLCVLNEILNTERDYVRNLAFLQSVSTGFNPKTLWVLQFEHPCAWLHVAVARLLLQSRLQAHKLEITGNGEAVKLCLSHCTVVKKEEEGEYVNQTAFLKQMVLARFFF